MEALPGRAWRRPRLLALAATGGTALVGASIGRFGAVVAAVAPSVLGGMVLVGLVQFLGPDEPAARRRLMSWTLAAFVVHLVLGLAIASSSTAVRYLGPDALTYHADAIRLVARWHGAPWPVPLPAGKEGFFYMLAGLYDVLGAHQVAGLAVNATLSAALIPLGADLTRRLFGPRPAHFVAPLLLVLPGFLIWTSQLLREAPTLFLLMLAACVAVRLAQRTSVPALLTLSLTLVLLFTFRATVALVASGGLVAGLALGRRRLVSAVGTGAAALGMTLALIFAAGVGYTGYAVTSRTNLRQVSAIRVSLGSANSGYGSDTAVETPGNALAFLPKGLVYFLLGPFPWQVHGLRQLPALGEAACLWGLIPSLLRGVAAARRLVGRLVLVLLLPAAGISITLALFLGNFGTVVRERLQVMVFLVPFIGLGLARRFDDDDAASSEPVSAAVSG